MFTDTHPEVEQALEAVAKVETAMMGILNKLESENREPSGTEKLKLDILQRQLESAVEAHNREVDLSRSAGRKTTPEGPQSNAHQLPATPRQGGIGFHSGQPAMMFRDSHGNEIRAHAGTLPLARLPGDHPTAGEYLRAIVLNDFSAMPASIQNSAHGGSGATGGFLLQPTISGQIIDLARSASVCLKAGAATLPIDGDTTLVRVTGDPDTHWRPELSVTPSSRATFGTVTLRPKMVACLLPISLELAEDAANSSQVLEMVARNALAAAMDKAILQGSGTGGEPLGILTTSGTHQQPSIGALTSYGPITTAVSNILTSNYSGDVSGLSWVLHPRTAAVIDGLKTGIASDNSPLPPTPWSAALVRHHTTGLFTASSPQRYQSIVGNFREVLIGLRYQGVILDVLNAGSVTDADDETLNLVSQFAMVLRLRMRMDVAVLRPDHFSCLTGIQG